MLVEEQKKNNQNKNRLRFSAVGREGRGKKLTTALSDLTQYYIYIGFLLQTICYAPIFHSDFWKKTMT